MSASPDHFLVLRQPPDARAPRSACCWRSSWAARSGRSAAPGSRRHFRRRGTSWPWATFLVNVFGAALLGVLRDAAAGAVAAVDVSPPVPRNRALWGADDVLDAADRGDRARPERPRAPRDRLSRRRAWSRACSWSRSPRPSCAGCRCGDEALIWGGVAVLGGWARSLRFELDGLVQGRVGHRVPVRHVRGQRARLVPARAADRARRHRQATCCSPAPPRSGRSRRSPRGCSRRERLAEDGESRLGARRTSSAASRSASRPPGSAGRSGRRCDVRLPEADRLLRRARPRSNGHLTSDVLLDLYERHEVQAAILLRATEGFGIKHQLHTQRMLTLSEDLPLVAVAVDTRERSNGSCPRCEALVDGRPRHARAGAARHGARRGGQLRGSRRGDEADPVPRPTGARSASRRRLRAVDVLRRHGVAGATVVLGVDGMTHGRRKRARFFSTERATSR